MQIWGSRFVDSEVQGVLNLGSTWEVGDERRGLGLKYVASGRSMKNNVSGLGLLAQNGAGAGALGGK